MKLILTEAEKKAKTWLELDDESVGKMVKATAFNIAEYSEDKKIFFMSAALVLCGIVVDDGNIGTMSITLDNLTRKNKSVGNWKVTVEKVGKQKESKS
jgi:hypothetical protein